MIRQPNHDDLSSVSLESDHVDIHVMRNIADLGGEIMHILGIELAYKEEIKKRNLKGQDIV